MKTFSSSAINKKGKKFAPKAKFAPQRRPQPVTSIPPSPSPAPSEKTSAEQAIPENNVRPVIEKEPLPDVVRAASIAPPTPIRTPEPTAAPVEEVVAIEQPKVTTTSEQVSTAPSPIVSERTFAPEPAVVNIIEQPEVTAPSEQTLTTSSSSAPQEPLIPEYDAVESIEQPEFLHSQARVTATPQSTSTSQKRKRSTATDSARETPAKRAKPAKRARPRREPTPEASEAVELITNVIKMSELCKDPKTGKKSQREMELRKHEAAARERKNKKDERPASVKSDNVEKAEEAAKPTGPQMRIVNGQIVLDNTSLEVDRHRDADRNMDDLEDVVETQLTRKVNQATYGKRAKPDPWDTEQTELFYRGLRMFGTDFSLVSKLFSGRTRRSIKLKFNNEEKRNPHKMNEVLNGPRESITPEDFALLTNTTYDDPKEFQKELEAEEKKIKERYAAEMQIEEDGLLNK